MELIRSWLTGITCAAMIVALAEGLAPAGAARKIGRLTGGLVLLIALLQPLLQLDSTALTRALTEYQLDLEAYSAELTEENREQMKEIIARQSEAYIADKAAQMGLECRVEVRVGDQEYPVPEEVTVTGALSPEDQARLTRRIEADFAIPAQRQHYKSGSEAQP